MSANIRTIGGALGASAMVSIATAGAAPGGLPKESGYTNGFLMLSGALVAQRAGRIVHPGKAGRGTVPRHARWRLAAFFVTPAMLLRWYCQLMARRWPNRRRPEPPVAAKIQTLVLRLGVENRAVAVGGYTVCWSDPGRRSAPCG